MSALLPLVKSKAMTEAEFIRQASVPRAVARQFIKNDGATMRKGAPPFLTTEEEEVLVRFIRSNAHIGRGTTRVDIRGVVGEYIDCLSAARQEAARALFGGRTAPGRSWMDRFLGRWPELQHYRAGTIENGRATNERPDVIASWFAALTLLYRQLRITHPRQVWNMDETAVKARDVMLHARASIIDGAGMSKPEVDLPKIGSGASTCTSVFTVSASGMVAPHFVVVEGSVPGHAFVRRQVEGQPAQVIPLASRLGDGATVRRRSPPGLDLDMFDVYCEHLAAFFPNGEKLLSIDRAKVHFSARGLLTLVRARFNVVVEPSAMSHLLQAIDSPAASGLFQPSLRFALRTRSSACVRLGEAFGPVELMDCIAEASSASLMVRALSSAFQRVGMWPLNPRAISMEALSKSAQVPVVDVDLEALVSRLIPIVSKELKRVVVSNGTLSTAGRATVLTSDEVIGALLDMDAAKDKAKSEKEKAKIVRAEQALTKKMDEAKKQQGAADRAAVAAWKRVVRDAKPAARARLLRDKRAGGADKRGRRMQALRQHLVLQKTQLICVQAE